VFEAEYIHLSSTAVSLETYSKNISLTKTTAEKGAQNTWILYGNVTLVSLLFGWVKWYVHIEYITAQWSGELIVETSSDADHD